MAKEDIGQEIRLKKKKEINNYFIKEIDQTTTLNYIEHCLTLVLADTIFISVFAVPSLIDIFEGIMSSTVGLNILADIARIKKYKSLIKKKKKK